MRIVRSRRAAVVAALLALLVAVDVIGDRTRRVVDLTEERSLTLTPQTRRIVGRLEGPVRATVFLARADPDRSLASPLLLRYRRLHRRLSFELVDPAEQPGEARRLGIDPLVGGIAVRYRNKVEIAPTVTEQDVTSALARLLRGRTATLCYAEGHGEAPTSETSAEGTGAALELLRDNGFRIETLDLLAARDVPSRCNAVLMVAPTAPLGDAASALRRYLDADGRLLLLTDPASTVDVGPVVAGHGLGIRRGIVIETDPSSARPEDPASPIVASYSSANPIVRRLAPTYFPGVQQVLTGEDDVSAGLTISPLARTSAASFLELEPLSTTFDPAVDVEGPIVVGAAADRSRFEGGKPRRSRVVLWGDADFVTNTFLQEAANSALLVKAADWLTLDEELVVLSTNLPEDRRFELTAARVTYARALSAGIIPALFLVLGGLVWALRRGR